MKDTEIFNVLLDGQIVLQELQNAVLVALCAYFDASSEYCNMALTVLENAEEEY